MSPMIVPTETRNAYYQGNFFFVFTVNLVFILGLLVNHPYNVFPCNLFPVINLSYKHAQFYMYFLDVGVSRPPAQFHLLLHLLMIPLRPCSINTEELSLVSCMYSGNGIPAIPLDTEHGPSITKQKKKARKAKTRREFSNEKRGFVI